MRVVLDGGQVIELGVTEATPTIGITDFSKRETDDFGVTTVVERNFARRMSMRFALPFDAVDGVQVRLADLRATAAQWIVDDRFAWLNFRGFYKEFELDVAMPPLSYCTLTVEGIAASEPFDDPGTDPAPDGAPSTLRLLQPAMIDGPALVSSSVPENDYAEWTDRTNYPVGARVIKAATHRIYESGAAGNIGNDPAGTSGKWIDIGPTNRWAMFDQALGSVTTGNQSIRVEVQKGQINAVALLDVVADTVRVQIGSYYDQTKQPSEGGGVRFLDVPATPDPVVVTIVGGGTVSVGTLLIGTLAGLGITEASPTAAITDFSRKEADEFGDIAIVPRAWAKRMSAKALIDTDAVDVVASRIAAVRARPALWIGESDLDSLSIYGFFRDFSIEVGQATSKLSLSIEGLSTAGKVEPLRAGTAWPDITDPDGTKPDDNADVTSENTSKDTAAVGGVPTPQVLDRIQTARDAIFGIDGQTIGIIAKVDDLINNGGGDGSSSAAAAAASAQAAKNYSETAGTAADNAEQARQGAVGAYNSAYTQAGNAETFRNQASTSADTATQKAATATEQAGLAATARQTADERASAASTSAGVASAKADEAGQQAQTAQVSQVRASTFMLDAQGHATNNIIGRGAFDERGKGNWHSPIEAQTYTAQDVAAGGFYVLQQAGRDAYEGEPVPGDWSGRRFRVSGNAVAFKAYVAYAGLQLTMADGSNQYPMVVADGPGGGYADFSGEIVLPATGVVAARPWLISDGPNAATDHGVNWRRIRIEDITAEKRAKDFADAASTSYSNAQIEAGKASSFAQAASGHADTAQVRRDQAESFAQSASGSASTATDKAASAATSATLAASVALGAGNAVTSDFANGLAGWNYSSTGLGERHVVGIDNCDFAVPGEHYVGILGLDRNGDYLVDEYTDWVAVQPGEVWQASAWIASRECVSFVHLQWGNGGGGFLSQGPSSPDVYNTYRGGVNLDGFRRVWTAPAATPAAARFVRMVFRKGGWIGGAGNPNNDLAWGMFLRPMLGRAVAGQGASPYVPRGGGAGLSSASARIEETRDVAAIANAAAAKVSNLLEVQSDGSSARLFRVEQAAVTAGQAAAQVKSVLGVDVDGQSPRLNRVEQVSADALTRTAGALYQQTVAVNGGIASLDMYALLQDGTPSSGIRLRAGTIFLEGDVVIEGSLSSSKVNGPTFAQEGTAVWTGSISPNPGQSIDVPFSLTLNPIQPRGRFHYELATGYTSNAGTQTFSTYNGKQLITNYLQDGGLFIRSYDDQGHTYVPRHGSHESVLATTIFGTTFVASISRGNYDSGIVNEGDYYSRTVSASHTVNSIRLNVLWVAI